MSQVELSIPIADIALGIFVGWFLIRIWIRFDNGVEKLTKSLEKYFEYKDKAKKMAEKESK